MGAYAGLNETLKTEAIGRAHEHHESIDSTNIRAWAWLKEGAPHGAVVTANRQTAGRGRMGRSWDSTSGDDIYASVALRPPPPKVGIGALGLAVGVALREGILAAAGRELKLGLKWPNDVLLDDRKVAGILCETKWVGDQPELVLGFGINVGRTDFPEELAEIATSLANAGVETGREAVLASVLMALEDVLGVFFEGGFPAIRERFEPHCPLLGQEVTVPVVRPDGSEERIVATALGLDDDGALRVRSAGGGEPFRVENADVWIRR